MSRICMDTASEPSADREQVTRLLQLWRYGDKQTLDELIPLVERQLHSLAERRLSTGRGDHTMRATALVNEAYLRLVTGDPTFQDRVHFLQVQRGSAPFHTAFAHEASDRRYIKPV